MSRQQKQPGAGLALPGKWKPCQHHWFFTLSALKPGFLLNSGRLHRQQKLSMLEPRRVLARPRSAHSCTRMPNMVAPNSFHQSPSTFVPILMCGGTVVVISKHRHQSQRSVLAKQLCLALLPWGRTENGAFSGLGGRGALSLRRAQGPGKRKADSLLTLSCSHESCQKHRSSWNKVSGAVLPVALLPVMTLCLFTLESCTTSILYNRS